MNPLLTPGSVWELKTGTQATVISVSNLNLPEALLERFPQQVVYLNPDLLINTQPVEAFLRKRSHVGVDEAVRDAVERMTMIDNDEDEEDGDEIDIDGIDLPEEVDAVSEGDDGLDVEGVDEDDAIPVLLPAVHAGLELNSHFVSYSEAPAMMAPVGKPQTQTLHVLRFALGDERTSEHLESIFGGDPADETTLTSFIVDSFSDRIEIAKFAFIGVYMEVDPEGNGTAAVYLTTNTQLPIQSINAPAVIAAAASGNAATSVAAPSAQGAASTLPNGTVVGVEVSTSAPSLIPQVPSTTAVVGVSAT